MAAETMRTGWPGRFDAERRRRAELMAAIHAFEQGVASPAVGPAWREQLRERVAALRGQLVEHVVVTEGPEGLYAELSAHAPRLTRPVSALVAEHAGLLARVDTLAQRLTTLGMGDDELHELANDLLAALANHRQRGADLVYEAFATDIGGET